MNPQELRSVEGFSLVELSIVLVILGLLTGGILGGQSLIHAAELRSIGEEYSAWQTATNTFKQKYFAVPGDFKTATDFWTARSDCGGSGGTSTATCNGNGDGNILTAGEGNLFWQHLSNAGLVAGEFAGTVSSGTDMFKRGTEVPSAKSGGVWIVLPGMEFSGGNLPGYTYALGSGEAVSVIADCPSATGIMCDVHSSLSPEDAWNIDTKLDDGKPGTGSVQAGLATGDCIADGQSLITDHDTAEYNLANSGKACFLLFPERNQGWAGLPDS